MASEKTLTASEIEDLVSRLSRQKESAKSAGDASNTSGRSLSGKEAEQLFERLSAPKKINSSPAVSKKRAITGLSREDIDQIFERLYTQKKQPSQPPVNRGEKLGQMDIDRIVERLSAQRTLSQEQQHKRDGVKISKKELGELVSRLTNKELALHKTPESRRTRSNEFGIVSSYAWNGRNHQAMLCNEESP